MTQRVNLKLVGRPVKVFLLETSSEFLLRGRWEDHPIIKGHVIYPFQQVEYVEMIEEPEEV